MKVTREQKVAEAVKRMKVLGLSVPVIFAFEKVGKIYCSDEVLFKELDDNYKKLVHEFETKHQAVVYHLIHTESEFGELLSILFCV